MIVSTLSEWRRIYLALSAPSRRLLWLLPVLIVSVTVTESVSIGAIVPMLGIASNPAWIEMHPEVSEMVGAIVGTGPGRLALVAVATFVVAYVAKVVAAIALAYADTRFACLVQCDIGSQLYSGYLRQPWEFHVDRDSAELIRNANIEPHWVAVYVSALLVFVSECFVACALVVLLFVFEPVGAILVLGVLGGASAVFQVLSRVHVRRWGEQRLKFEAERLRRVQGGLGAIKDVILGDRSRFFASQYSRDNQGAALMLRRAQFLGYFPRLWLESVTVFGLASLVLANLLQGQSIQSVLPTLALFAAVAFRLIPSLNRMLGAVSTMRFRQASVAVVSSELGTLLPQGRAETKQVAYACFKELLMENVRYRHRGAAQEVLRGVTLSVQCGQMIGIVGTSGAGKSTLVDVLVGLLSPTEGRFTVDGHCLIGQGLYRWRRSVGYVPQAIVLVNDTIRRNVAFGLPDAEIDEERVWRALQQAHLDEFVLNLPLGLETKVGELGVRLSGGQRQRVGIARALYADPAVLVLDESTSALDTATEGEIMDVVCALRGEKTIVIVAHRESAVIRCDIVYRLEAGMLHQTTVGPQGPAIRAN